MHKKIIKKIKENYGYFKRGVAEDRKEYEKLQRIKNTPWDDRTKLEQDWADMMNKTKRRKK